MRVTTSRATFAGLALIAALCGGFTLDLTAPAWAGFDEGMAAYQRGDYATALREWRSLAKQGNAIAQNNLGFMYDKGHGVSQGSSTCSERSTGPAGRPPRSWYPRGVFSSPSAIVIRPFPDARRLAEA